MKSLAVGMAAVLQRVGPNGRGKTPTRAALEEIARAAGSCLPLDQLLPLLPPGIAIVVKPREMNEG
jgi:hypothetical protein